MPPEEIQYIGEHLLPGKLGNAFIVISFIASLFATYGYYKSLKTDDAAWKSLSRLFFRIHTVSVFGIASTLFYIIFNHYFEYDYAYQHSSSDLPLRYMLSCFWEGQEGSFLLWIFWHVILGNILIHTSKSWENSVMTIFSSVQVLLGSMLLGVYVLGIKIGSNPFMLLRENVDMMNIPIFQNPEYLRLIEGTGLNPLLQNYWMTIHPPTLFLGFASTLIPFCYAIASLWEKKYTEWLRPVLPWAFFGILILGAGVLMGGAWAYEALSFGGFWAWDPVENASLVPWLFLVGAAHLVLVNHKKKDSPTSLASAYLVTIFTFLLVLYSTYLTRSGILGETSVHSFADGMPGQLIVFLLLYVIGSMVLFFTRYKSMPRVKEEEQFLSREFWMLIGSLVLVISAFQITFTTSIPVINAIFGTNMAPPIDAVNHFNSWQVPFAIIISSLMALAQYLSYRKTPMKRFYTQAGIALASSLLLTFFLAFTLKLNNSLLIALMFTSLLAILGNTDYFIRILKGKIKNAGASIAHVGFALVLLGSLLSAGMQTTISTNTSGIDIRMKGEEGNANLENILLYKNDTLPMGPYLVTYVGKKKEGINILYEVSYTNRMDKSEEPFSLFPRIQLNKNMGNVPEPDTRHFLTKDLFSHVTYVNEQDFQDNVETDYQISDTINLKKGDTSILAPYVVTLEGVTKKVDKEKYNLLEEDIAIKALLHFDDLHNNISTFEPIFIIRDNQLYNISDEQSELGYRLSLVNVDPLNGMLTFIVEKDLNKKDDFIIMKATIFPYINVLWIGCIIMILGTGLAIYQRIKKAKQ